MRILVTPTQLANELNVTRKSVYQAERSGRISRAEDGLYDLRQTRADWHENILPSDRRAYHTQDQPSIKEVSVVFWELMWNQMVGPWALAIRDMTDAPPKKVLKVIGLLLLIQWQEMEKFLGYKRIDLDREGPVGQLMSEEGLKRLESWLTGKQ